MAYQVMLDDCENEFVYTVDSVHVYKPLKTNIRPSTKEDCEFQILDMYFQENQN